MSVSVADLRARYERAGQGHVFRHFDKLSDSKDEGTQAKMAAFLEQLASIDVDLVNELYTHTMADAATTKSTSTLAPPKGVVSLFNNGKGSESAAADVAAESERYRRAGLEMIARGEASVMVLGGGQGTRLGYDRPKGEYDIGLPSHKSLYQMQTERVRRIKALAAAEVGVDPASISLPFYVMTSPMTDEDTRKYFADNNFFGLSPTEVVFFCQGTLPCLSNDGKILLEHGLKVAQNPDGNGGIYRALHTQGIITHMQAHGVKGVHVFAVDNAIVKVGDPVFLGLCAARNADVGSKVCAKAGPHERVGVLCFKDGAYSVVEYTEMDKTTAEQVDEATGQLAYNAGNLCIHYYSVDFLNKECSPASLPKIYHIARKNIPIVDEETGLTMAKDKLVKLGNTGLKLESFIFDVFPQSKTMAILDVQREKEFTPVKNAPGSKDDSPDTARALITAEHRRWVEAAGAVVVGDGPVEVSPLVSYDGEGLAGLRGITLVTPVLVASSAETIKPQRVASAGVGSGALVLNIVVLDA